ncbi:MAG: BamA/TamA family outer membrane protein [candidate division Zixibacteria bacterium]|nr:BamA/TamA family outer membrane protein [candidate division Zixibacteria bacterium]
MKYIICLLIGLVLVAPAMAQDSTGTTVEINFSRSSGTIVVITDRDSSKIEFQFGEVRKTGHQILLRDRVLISGDSLFVGDNAVNLAEMMPSDVTSTRSFCEVTLTKQDGSTRSRRGTERNRFASFQRLSIPPGDFVRGNAFCVGGELVVEGEVNGNVVSLFGNVKLMSSAVCQRDVLAIGGSVHKHLMARVNGTYQSTDAWHQVKARYHRKSQDDKSVVQLGLGAAYNRVDGLLVMPEIAFQSEEKFMPKFYFKYGYGFASKRSVYQLGIEQKLFDYNQTKLGGSVYRLTKTEDDWISHGGENSLYAVLAREDFRDYYGAEGGNVYVEQSLGFAHTFRVEYSYESLSWLPAHTGLWSLFGGDKRFRQNFSSVEAPRRNASVSDYDKNEAVLKTSYVLNTVEDERGELARAGWVGGVHYEHSSSRLGSDFAFDRFIVELRRYQPLTYMQNFNVRLIYGGATGNLPLHRLFYLGGIRTLRGYDIKQFYGSRMAMANCEYVVDFPRTIVGLALLFDIGKTGRESDFLSKGEWRGDVGIGVRFDDWLRLEFTRQINGDTDKLQLSALIGSSF